MAKTRKLVGIQAHPMIRQITDALMRGESARSIARWAEPKVGHASVHRYATARVKPIMRNADTLVLLLPTNKEVSEGNKALTDVGQPEQQARQLAREAILGAPILAAREKRLAEQQDRHNRLRKIVEERGKEMGIRQKDENGQETEEPAIPGGSTGLLVRKLKRYGPEYAVDTGLLSEFREHEKQIAIELGQWEEHAPAPNVSIRIVVPGAGPGSVPFDREDSGEPDYIDISPPQR